MKNSYLITNLLPAFKDMILLKLKITQEYKYRI
jgi:hypothetical protein